MSFQAMALAVKIKTEKPTEKLILLMLANYADENNQCYPSYARLAEDCCMTDRGIKAIMGRLRKAGFVTWVKRNKRPGSKELTSNLYTLHLDRPVAPIESASDFHAPPVHVENGGSERGSLGVVNEVHGGSEPASQEPIIESSKLVNTPRAVENFNDEVMAELMADKLPGEQVRYAGLKIREYQQRFADSDSVADCWAYVAKAVNHRIQMEG